MDSDNQFRTKVFEEALRENKEYFRLFVDASLDVVYCMSPDWTEMRQLHGREFIPDTWNPCETWMDKYIHPDDQAHIQEAIKKAIHNKTVFEMEHRILQADGTIGWIHSRAVPVLDENGEIMEWFGTARDITEQKKGEEELEFQAGLLTNVNNALTAVDENYIVTYWNNAAEQLFGWSKEEVMGKHSKGIFQTKVPDSSREEAIEKMLKEDHYDDEVYYKHKNGKYILTHVCSTVLKDHNGKFKGSITSFQDITERKNAEDALRESEEKYRLIVDTAYEGIVIADPEGTYTYVNQRMADMLGCSIDEILGKSGNDFIFDDFLPVVQEIRTGLGEGHSIQGEFKFRRKDGSVLWTAYNSTAVYDDEGRHIANIGMHTDITDRRKAEKALQESEKHYSEIVETAEEGIAVHEPDGTITYVNQRMADMLGYPREELIGSLSTDFVDGEEKELVIQTRKNLKYDGSFTRERKMSCKDGSTLWTLTNLTPRRDNAGNFIGYLAMHTDITERKKAEEKLKESENRFHSLYEEQKRLTDELKSSNKDLEQFAYVASHDLQEPLRMVASFTQLLEMQYKDKLDDKGLEYIAFAVDGAKRMQELINDLLVFSRVTSKADGFKPVDMCKVYDEVLFNLEIIIEENDAVITRDSLPVIFADYSQMVQIFQNLIGNALKYRSKKTPNIHISIGAKDNHWLFAVKDNGIGIESEFTDKIFDIFRRLHTNDEYEGTGIGLSITKRIVERHGGKIWVESEPGQGSTFYFTIPK